MLKNYLKTALRQLTRNRLFSGLNILGLAIGLCGSLFIFLWVQDELGYDRQNPGADDIYRLTVSVGQVHAATSPIAVAPALQRMLPGVRQVTRFYNSGNDTRMVAYGENRFIEKRVWYADSNFEQLFTFPLIKGDPTRILQRKEDIVITESMARKYFGDKDPIGQRLRIDDHEDHVVTGVLRDLPDNSHLQFDFLLPLSIMEDGEKRSNTEWTNCVYFGYLRLDHPIADDPVAIAGLEKKTDSLFHRHKPDFDARFTLQRLTAIHLGEHYFMDVSGSGSREYVRIFSLVAVFILLIACINFMNLSTALSARRAKEVGLRKTVGATRAQLIGQFLGEAVLLALVSLGVSMLLMWLLLPAFNGLTGKTFTPAVFDGSTCLLLVGVAVLAGLVSGSYPALVLSGFRPVQVLKNMKLFTGGKAYFRNGLVVLQFTIAIALIVGTIVVYRQLHFIQNRDMGFDKSNLLYVSMPVGDQHIEMRKGAKLIDERLAGVPGIVAHSVVGDLPTNLTSGDIDIVWPGKDPREQPVFAFIGGDDNFLTAFGMHLRTGRFFSRAFGADDSSVVPNETALRLMHMDPATAVGRTIRVFGRECTIVGVVKDFNFKPVQFAVEPLLIVPKWWRGNEYVVVRTEPGATGKVISGLRQQFNAVYPTYPFTYGFVDQDIDRLYLSEQQMGQLFNVFSVIAIVISCLGLFGLSAYTTARRIKEIGVRKVLGASVTGIVSLLAREFLVPVAAATLIAFPLAGWVMGIWLHSFAYRIGLEWWFFAVAGMLALLIALGTVGYQALVAARANPMKALRSE